MYSSKSRTKAVGVTAISTDAPLGLCLHLQNSLLFKIRGELLDVILNVSQSAKVLVHPGGYNICITVG